MMKIEAGERQYELVEGWGTLPEGWSVLGRFGSERSNAPGKFWGSHCIWVDSQGDLYVGEVLEGQRLQKFARCK